MTKFDRTLERKAGGEEGQLAEKFEIRLGRDTRDVLNLIQECEQRDAFVTVLDPHVSTRGEMGHIVLTVLGMVAQMERRSIKERQRDGIEQAKAAGAYRGGKRRLDRERIQAAAPAQRPFSRRSAARACRYTACLLDSRESCDLEKNHTDQMLRPSSARDFQRLANRRL